MDIAMPSRFACLNIEDDDFRPQKGREQRKKPDSGTVNKKGNTLKHESSSMNVKKSGKQQQQQNAAKKVKKSQPQPLQKQWEEWKEKDKELVNGTFEQDLQNAIMLSKLEYEERKEGNKQTLKKTEEDKKTASKKKKNKTVSLTQFLTKTNATVDEKTPTDTNNPVKDEFFFERIKEDTKEELTKEKILQRRKQREANIEEVITVSQLQEKLRVEIEKNAELLIELERAKKEIAAVKNRNKKLCNILGHGEMKDKADVLLELERLTEVKNDLTDEVARLHGLLEQERSKVASLELQNKHKDKKNKKNGLAKV